MNTTLTTRGAKANLTKAMNKGVKAIQDYGYKSQEASRAEAAVYEAGEQLKQAMYDDLRIVHPIKEAKRLLAIALLQLTITRLDELQKERTLEQINQEYACEGVE